MGEIDSIGAVLNRLRRAREVTQVEMAKHLGCSVSMYSAFEVNRKVPSPNLIEELIKYLEPSPAEAEILQKLANDRRKEVRIDTGNLEPSQVEVASIFARRISKLEPEELERLKRVLIADS